MVTHSNISWPGDPIGRGAWGAAVCGVTKELHTAEQLTKLKPRKGKRPPQGHAADSQWNAFSKRKEGLSPSHVSQISVQLLSCVQLFVT